MLAQQNDTFMETCETIFQKNQDRNVRYWCEAREEAERIARSVEREYQRERQQNLAALAEMRNTIQEQSNALAEKDNALAELRAQIATLMAQLNQK